MRAIHLTRLGVRASTSTIKIPSLEHGGSSYLLKLTHSPVHPADIYLLKGIYGDKKSMPCILGFEGAGIIVEGPQHLIGKVAAGLFFQQGGSFAEYSVVDKNDCIVFDEDNISDTSTVAGCLLNPLTCYGIIDKVLSNKFNAIVQTAAGSDVGRMVIKKAKSLGIPTINIVRREMQISELRAIGADHVLCSTSPTFIEELTDIISPFSKVACFEAVSGNLSGAILGALPSKSHMYMLGSLSLKQMSELNPVDLIFKEKEVKGFHLNKSFLSNRNINEFKSSILEDLNAGIISTKWREEITLEGLEKGIQRYLKEMSTGKLLLRPNLPN